MNTVANKSSILKEKTKFFIFRIVTYFSFLLLPIYIQKGNQLSNSFLLTLMAFYSMFMIGQWYLIGKEFDYRFKIYSRVNASLDRVLSRIFTGMVLIIFYFSFLSLFSAKWINNFFWITWIVTGIFYSWPTRGKIIQESMSSNISEFKFLDSFERTLLLLIIIFFIVSMYSIPSVTGIPSLKLLFDPSSNFATPLWNFLTVTYYPFLKYAVLFKMAWFVHFYLVGLFLLLLTFYSFLRFFVSRRLSLLGVFALISSWSFSLILMKGTGSVFITCFSIIWVWCNLLILKSGTYRSGILFSFIGVWGSIINQNFIIIFLLQLVLIYFYLIKNKHLWFRKQFVKYTIPGIIVMLVLFFKGDFSLFTFADIDVLHRASKYIERKAFYILSCFGLIILMLKQIVPKLSFINGFKLDKDNYNNLFIIYLTFVISSLFITNIQLDNYTIMWNIVFLSLIPLELIFQRIGRLRSSRNMIYLVYILICLLDSHFEVRVRIFSNLLN